MNPFLFHKHHSLPRLIYFSGPGRFGREVGGRGELKVGAELTPTLFKVHLALFQLGLAHRSRLLDACIDEGLVVGVQKGHRE